MLRPTDEDIESLCSNGARPVERYVDGSIVYTDGQNHMGAALWLDHGYTSKQAERMILALDLVPDDILKTVSDDLSQPETRPRKQPTFRQIAEKCWAAMLVDKDLQRLYQARKLRHRTE